MNISEIINELGEDRENYFHAVSPAIAQSSNFSFPTVQAYREALAKEMDVPFYTRGHNPTVAILRKKIAALEGAEDCLMFSSGSGAVAAAILSQVKAGDHIVSVQKPYSWTFKLMSKWLTRFGVETTYIDGKDTANFAQAIRPNTRLFVLESPNSMTFEMQDLEAVCALAKEKGIVTVIDNSYASPLNQNPIAYGADIVVHSATKYLNGHSDVVAGALCSTRAICEAIFAGEYMTLGAAMSPHDAWLMLRGLRTLPIRMRHIAENAPKIVAFLENHPKVKKVYYPHSPSFEQVELAKKYLKQPCGLFSIELDAPDLASVERFCDSLKHFLMAVSWGGYESLLYPVCALYTSANYNMTTLPWNMVRISVGFEDTDMLIADLENALGKI